MKWRVTQTTFTQEDIVSIQKKTIQAHDGFFCPKVLFYDEHIGQGFMAGRLCALYRDAKWYLVSLDDMQRGTERRGGIR